MSVARQMMMAASGAGGGGGGFNLTNASYDGVSFDVSGQRTDPNCVVFNSDGTKMYLAGLTPAMIHQYSLSVAYSVSTAVYDGVSLDVLGQEANLHELNFSTDGTKLFIIGTQTDSVFQYNLSSAFDLSTAVYSGVSFSVASQEATPRAFTFSTDGTKLFVIGTQTDRVHQYSLSPAFDLSTASYDNEVFIVTLQDVSMYGIRFNTDGTKMFLLGQRTRSVYQYSLPTPFSLVTVFYDNVSFSVSGQDTDPQGLTFNSDGSKMYVVGDTTNTIYQYSTT